MINIGVFRPKKRETYFWTPSLIFLEFSEFWSFPDEKCENPTSAIFKHCSHTTYLIFFLQKWGKCSLDYVEYDSIGKFLKISWKSVFLTFERFYSKIEGWFTFSKFDLQTQLTLQQLDPPKKNWSNVYHSILHMPKKENIVTQL